MIRTRTLLIYIGLAILEAMPPALLLAFWGAPSALVPLLVVVGGAALVDALAQRWLAAEPQRVMRAAAVLALALWATKSLLLGSMNPFDGWGEFAALIVEDAWGFLVLVVALYAAWRGLRLPLYENEGLRDIFARSMASLLGVLLIGNWTSRHDDPILPAVVTSELVIAFAAGLIAVALARHDDVDQASRPLGWRNLTPIFGAIGVILLLSIVLGSLLGGGAAAEILLNGLVLILAAIGALLLPIFIVLLSGLAWIMEQLHVERAFLALQELSRFLQSNRLTQSNALLDATRAFPWLGPLLNWTGRLLPVLVLLAAIYLFSRRRTAKRSTNDEERESLFSWSQLADDLRDLLGNRRTSNAGGLQAALANLRGNDPASRIRRSYIRMLIAAEQRQQPRAAPQTPYEYMPRARTAFPQAPQSVAELTSMYEKARYHPQSVSEPDAETAERALDALGE